MPGWQNDIGYTDNLDLSGAAVPALANGLIADGQLWIASTALNPGGTHINVGKIVSPDGSITTGYDGTNITLEVSGNTPGTNVARVFDDFISTPLTGITASTSGAVGNSGATFVCSGSGVAFVNSIAGTATNPGIVTLSCNSSSNDAVVLFYGPASATTGSIALGGGQVSIEWLVRIPTLSTGAQRFTCRAGLANNLATASNTPTQGCYFEYIDNVNSGAWTINNKAAGTTSANTTNTADTDFHNLKVVVNAGATSVAYFYDGVQVGTSPLTGNIPTQTLCPFMQIVKSVGGTARTFDVDFMNLIITLTTARPG